MLPATPPNPAKVKLREYARALPYLRTHAPRMALIVVLSIVSTGSGLLAPLVNKSLIDDGLLAGNFGMLWKTAAAMAALTIFGFITNVWSSYMYVRLSAQALFAMRLDLYRHLQRISPRHHARARLGDFLSRLNNDVAEVQRVSGDALLSLLANVVFLVGATVLMIRLDVTLFLVSIALLPPALWMSRYAQRRLAAHVKVLRERSSSIGSFLLESLMGLRLTTLVNAQEREVARFGRENGRFVDALMKMQMTNFLAGAVPATAVTLSTAAVFLWGGHQVLQGALTVGSLVAFLAYHARLLSPVQNLMSLYGSLVTGAVSLRRMFEVLEVPIEVHEPTDPVLFSDWRGEIEFDQVAFDHGGEPILTGATFRLQAGETYVLTGPSGAGKSTIADLTVRLCDPSSGMIRLDGQNLRRIPLRTLREQIAVVEQTPILFHGTIGENISYARPEATIEEIQRAALDAALALPLETQVGERGAALSVGERQRVAIARALLRNPKVLILDEPVSALDPEARVAIQETLRGVLVSRTGLIISHEAGVLAGKILRLRGGKVEPEAAWMSA